MRFLIAAIAILSTLSSWAGDLIFDKLDHATLLRGEERHQMQELASPAPGEPERLKFAWQKDRFRYAEFKVPINSLPPVESGIAELRVFLPEGSRVGRIALRLTDRSGETFQFYPLSATVKPGGWTTLSFRLTEADANGSWGGNNDKKIDRDLRLTGLAVNFPPQANAGTLFFDTLKLTASDGALLESREDYLRFDSSELYTYRISYGNATLTPGADGLTVSGRADNKGKLTLTERKFALTPLAPAHKVILKLADVQGRGTIRMSFRDSQGTIQRAHQTYTPESRELVFPFPDSKAPSGHMQSMEIEPETGDFRLRLTGSERIVRRTAAEAIAFDVETGNLLHVLPEGEEAKLAFTFHNRSREALTARAELEFRDYYDRTVTETFDLELAPGAVEQRQLSQVLPARGIWYVTNRLSTTGKHSDTALTRRAFAWMKPSGPTPGRAKGFLFGICSHPQRWSWLDQELEAQAMAWCGAKVLRNDIGWNNIEPTPGSWNFSSMDRKLELFDRHHIELAPIWAYTARWAAPPETRDKGRDWFRTLPDYDAWENFVRTITARYRGKIRFWEIWNEPDFSGSKFNSDEYAEMMKRAYRAAKEADPEAIIQSGGFATVKDHPSRKGNFHEEALVKGRGYFDIHAYHEHGRFSTYRAALELRFFPMRERTGTTVPWWPNETAINSLGGNEHLQAATLFQKLIYSWATGAIGYNWYNLRNDGFDAKNGEHNYGMISNDFYPKAVYVAFNTLTGLYSNARFLRRLDGGDYDLRAYLFAGENELLIAGWNDTLQGSSVPLLLKTDATNAEIIDLMGNRKVSPISNNIALLELGRDPVTLRLIGGTQCEVVGTLLEVEPLPPLLAGHTLPLTIQIRNAFPETREFQFWLEAPAGISVTPTTGSVALPPGKDTAWSTTMKIDDDFIQPPESSQHLRIHYTASVGNLSGEVRLPLIAARQIPAGAMRDDAPDFRLERREQAVSLFEADPSKIHLLWQGPEDRSALTWLRLTGETLQIRFDVTDDKHVQPHRGVGVWRGDNVQMGILLPKQDMTWEIGLTRLDSGESEVYLWSAPSGVDLINAARQIKLNTGREGTLTRYQAEIPLTLLGVKAADLAAGIRFNALVNDDDGEGREGWIQIAPGIGENKNPTRYPLIVFQ